MSYLVLDKAEEAISALVTALTAGLSPVPRVVTGRDFTDSGEDDLIDGLIICSADGEGQEAVKDSGNFVVNGMIEMKFGSVANADGTGAVPDPTPYAKTIVDTVSVGIITSTLAADLSAAATPLTVYPNSIEFQSPTRKQDENGFWIDVIQWRMVCCAADL